MSIANEHTDTFFIILKVPYFYLSELIYFVLLAFVDPVYTVIIRGINTNMTFVA